MMKNIAYIKQLCLALLGSIVIYVTPANAQWVKLNSGTTTSLNVSYFVDQDTGYVVGFNGEILKTNDGGNNWGKLNSGTNKTLNDVYFTSSNNGFIAVDDGLLLSTTNGGTTWESKHIDSTRDINAVFFVNDKTGFVGGNDKLLMKTTDGGKTWFNPVDTMSAYESCKDIRTLYFFDENTGYAGGGGKSTLAWGIGIILKTNDGGISWHTFNGLNGCYDYTIDNLICISTQTCFGVGNYFVVNDGSKSKALKIDNDSASVIGSTGWIHYFNDIYMTAQGVGYVVGYPFIYKTTDYFQNTWITDTTHSDVSLNDLFFVNNQVGYAVGNGGDILKTTNAGLGVENKELKKKTNFLYPNPATDKISLTFIVEKYESVFCTLHDLLGQEITRVINNVYYSPGSYTKELDISFLKPGVYFFTFQSSTYSETKKIVKTG